MFIPMAHNLCGPLTACSLLIVQLQINLKIQKDVCLVINYNVTMTWEHGLCLKLMDSYVNLANEMNKTETLNELDGRCFRYKSRETL